MFSCQVRRHSPCCTEHARRCFTYRLHCGTLEQEVGFHSLKRLPGILCIHTAWCDNESGICMLLPSDQDHACAHTT